MKSEYQNTIVNKIRKLRQSKGLSQFQIATIIGISSGQMGNIESPSCSHKYTLAHISLLCKEFGVRIEELFLDNQEGLSQIETIDRLVNSIIEYEK